MTLQGPSPLDTSRYQTSLRRSQTIKEKKRRSGRNNRPATVGQRLPLAVKTSEMRSKLPRDIGGAPFEAQQRSKLRQKLGLKLGDQLVPVVLKISR